MSIYDNFVCHRVCGELHRFKQEESEIRKITMEIPIIIRMVLPPPEIKHDLFVERHTSEDVHKCSNRSSCVMKNIYSIGIFDV